MDEKITLLVVGPNSKNGKGSGTIRNFTKSSRLTSAIKKAGFCLVGAVLGAFIPVLHFVIVPSLLIGALFSFIFTYKRKSVLIEVNANCPFCSAQLAIGKVEPDWPLAVSCPGCSTQLYVQDASLEPLISISAQ